ncbi:hypothetical protein AGABI2DRAFT_186593 [Agaricus bisporus var. bisporus H97]|uniref:hypothetical protein n=1 Tax=Agaricus bisporus var. bisporus (strain H97 / ATCC MYA-4626 / FGSC 10389) TaxID=936046 RepID=UPI00029F54E5|nr:hypothetical protein AGABI2DRAFT_186593 [Agaricus bisporus var. bisporus H97]EKV45897.1 hypothetical protein AGABI2DRAFT_186593 [Agaricus bisporus var. bisporus H97]
MTCIPHVPSKREHQRHTIHKVPLTSRFLHTDMPLNLRYPGATRKNTISKTTDGPAVAERNRSPQPGTSLTTPVKGVVPERPKQTTPKKQTDTPPRTLTRKPSQASIYSTTSITEKKRPIWRGVAKTLPGMLKSPRGASSTSLASISQEPAPPLPGSVDSKSASTPRSKIPARRTTLSPKASTLDKLSTTPAKSIPLEESEHVIREQRDITRTSNGSDGSDTLVEELQSTARSLNEELSAMQHKLNEATNECSALHEHIRTLESANDEQLRRSVEEAVKHAKDELLGSHASELGAQQDRILDLQKKNDGLTSRLVEIEQLKEKSDRDSTTEINSLRRQLRDLQNSLESVQHDLKTKDDVVAGLNQRNEELYARIANLEAERSTLTEGAAEMEEGLLKDVGLLRHQLEDAQHTLSERDIQMSELQSEKAKVEDMLVRAHAVADEKEMVIGDLKRRGNGLEERNEELERKILDLEREETRLKATTDDYERQIIDAAGDAQMLRDQLASSTSLAQQLQSSLDALSIENKESLQAAADKFSQLQEQHAALVETMQALESENNMHQTEKADMIRIHSAEIEAERRAVRNLRRSMESIARDSGAKDDRSSVLIQANEELQQEIMNLKKLREGEEQESRRLRKESVENTVAISTLEEKRRVLLEVLTAEKEKLSGEADHLRRQLTEAKLRLQEHDSQAQSQGVDEQKRNEEVQKANAIIDEQRTVIGRLQQSIGELSKDDDQPPKPRLLLNVMKPDPSRTHVQRSQTSPVVSNTLPPRPPPPPKRSTTGGNETHAPSIAQSTSSTPLKTFMPTTSLDPSSHEASRMLTDHERAFQADSDSEGDHTGCQRQLRDMKRGKAQAHASFAYKMGRTVFGSLWRKVWG